MSTSPFNTAPNDPSLKDVLDKLKQDIFFSFNSHHIGTIGAFNPLTQTATATINYKKTYFQSDPLTGIYTEKLKDYPILLDCPCILLGGGLSSLTFPIAPGDECLILFNDRDINNWFAGGSGGPVASARSHSFSDGLIIVGIRSLGNVLKNYDMIRAKLQNGEAMVGVGPILIKIANQAFTLNELLQELIDEVKDLVSATAGISVTGISTGTSSSGPPGNIGQILAVSVSLTATALKIEGLLE